MAMNFKPAQPELNLLNTVLEMEQVCIDTGVIVCFLDAVDFEEDAVNVTKHALQNIIKNNA